MCKFCFEKEIYRFNTYEEYQFYDNLFFSKTADKILLPQSETVSKNNYYIHKCIYCGEEWVIDYPDNRPGGFLLMKESVLKLEEKRNQTNIVGVVFIAVILLLMLFLILF